MTDDLSFSGLIVCGADESDGARDAARVAAWLCRELDSRLVLMHVARPPATPGLASAAYAYPGERDYEAAIEAARTLLGGIIAEFDLDEVVASQVVTADPAERLREFAAEAGANLFVVGVRGRGPLRSALLGSVSSALAAEAPCPVVVVPPNTASDERALDRRERERKPAASSPGERHRGQGGGLGSFAG